MANDLTLKNFWRLPLISFPSFMEDIEEILPTSNLLNGLSLSEDEKSVYVEAAVPGIDPQDIDITFSNGLLTIKGEREKEESGKTFHKKATRSFLYRVTPDDIDVKAEPEAVYKNGVMTVKFAKLPKVEPRRIAVKTT